MTPLFHHRILTNPIVRQAYVGLLGLVFVGIDSFTPIMRGHPVALWDLYIALAITIGDFTAVLFAYLLCVIALLFFIPFFAALPIEFTAFTGATLVVVHAIQRRRRAEAQLDDSNQSLRHLTFSLHQAIERERTVLEHSPNAIISIDGEGRILTFNQTAQSLFGWTALEAIGQDLGTLLIPARFRARHWAGLRHFARTGEAPIENLRIDTMGLTRDGQEIPLELVIRRVPLQRDAIFTAFIRDLSRPSSRFD